MGKHGYWINGRPTRGFCKGWQGADHADTITDKLTDEQMSTIIARYNARAAEFNRVQLTPDFYRPTVNGAAFCCCSEMRTVALIYQMSCPRWFLNIRFVPRFKWWPGRDVALITRANIERIDLHWVNGAHEEFYHWLAQ